MRVAGEVRRNERELLSSFDAESSGDLRSRTLAKIDLVGGDEGAWTTSGKRKFQEELILEED